MDAVEEVLLFDVGGQRHALRIAQVRELLPALSTTPLPGSPPWIEGVINLRGVMVPVLDMRQRFGLPAGQLPLPTTSSWRAWGTA